MIESIDNLAHQLSKLPSIGNKTAQRLAYAIISLPESEVRAMAEALVEAKTRVHFCKICGHYTESELCSICANPQRSDSTICVVRDPKDVFALEKTQAFSGKYHVLHGLISPMNGIGPEDIALDALIQRVKKGNTSEIVLATNSDMEGEATSAYIASLLKEYPVKITRIAHGVPVGSNLEYIDEITLEKAFSHRREL